MERFAGFSTRRTLPRWRRDVFRGRGAASRVSRDGTAVPHDMPLPRTLRARAAQAGPGEGEPNEVVLFADTFNRYFEPENIEAAMAVLEAAGLRVHLPRPADGSRRPLCCGRTFLAVGLVEEARREAERCVATLAPFATRGIPIVGLEPSCLLGFRDEIPALLKSDEARWLASRALTFEEFIVGDLRHDALALAPVGKRALVHGHCHQKSFGVMDAVTAALKLVPDLTVATIESSCCGMAGAFGYGADTIDVSMEMGELSLFPSVRAAQADTLLVADGTSCRQQIRDGAGREALHVARVLAMSLQAARPA